MPSEIPTVPLSLRARAEKLRGLASRYEQLKTEGNAVEAVGQRTDALRKLADAARPVSAAAKLLFAAGIPVPDLPCERLAIVRDAITRVAGATASDPDAVLSLNSADLKNALAAVGEARKAIAAAWERFVSDPVPGEAIVSVLTRFEAFRTPVARAKLLRDALTAVAGKLPATAADIDKVRANRNDLAAVFRELDGSGIGADRLDFLRLCVAGVPLVELLSTHELLAWLRENPLLTAAIRVQVG